MTFSRHTVGSVHHITDAKGNTVAIIPDGPNAEANRDFVATALNSHDELVSALRRLTKSVDDNMTNLCAAVHPAYQEANDLLDTL